MLDTTAVQRMVEQEIKTTVNEQVLEVLTSEDWLLPLEQKIIKFSQDRILAKFANSGALPEIVDAIKTSVSDLFTNGQIPGIDQYVDQSAVKLCVDQAVEQLIQVSITQLSHDPLWIEKIERMINQTIVQRTVASISGIDIQSVIRDRVDENMAVVHQQLLENFASTGIDDQATTCQLTIMDEVTVVENQLTVNDLESVSSIKTKDLVVTGSINTDNRAWNTLAEVISDKTLNQLSDKWHADMVNKVAEKIKTKGIEFDRVTVDGQYLVDGNRLAPKITHTSIETVGHLVDLTVRGETDLNDTVNVKRKRMGINTKDPEMALSVWDEEVSIIIGKHKAKQAYIGTNRDQGVVIGVNRLPQIEMDTDGLTTIKKLRVGVHRISHEPVVPGYSGTKGDVVFNSSPTPDRVFAWVCLGGHKWQTLKSAE